MARKKLQGQFSQFNTVAKHCKNCGQIASQQPEIASIVVKMQPWFPEVFEKKGKVTCPGKYKPHKLANKLLIEVTEFTHANIEF